MKPSLVQPYLFFNGRCEEAFAFYQSAIGARPDMLMRFKDSPEPAPEGMMPENWEEKIMHASIRIGDDLLMASDGCAGGEAFAGFSLSLTLPDASACERAFQALADGGEVTMPLGQTFWSPCFGMLTDRFGLGWMITVPDETA